MVFSIREYIYKFWLVSHALFKFFLKGIVTRVWEKNKIENSKIKYMGTVEFCI